MVPDANSGMYVPMNDTTLALHQRSGAVVLIPSPHLHQTEPLAAPSLQQEGNDEDEQEGRQTTTFRLDMVACQEGTVSFDVVQVCLLVEYLGTGIYAKSERAPLSLLQQVSMTYEKQGYLPNGLPYYSFQGRVRRGTFHTSLMHDLFKSYEVMHLIGDGSALFPGEVLDNPSNYSAIS